MRRRTLIVRWFREAIAARLDFHLLLVGPRFIYYGEQLALVSSVLSLDQVVWLTHFSLLQGPSSPSSFLERFLCLAVDWSMIDYLLQFLSFMRRFLEQGSLALVWKCFLLSHLLSRSLNQFYALLAVTLYHLCISSWVFSRYSFLFHFTYVPILPWNFWGWQSLSPIWALYG